MKTTNLIPILLYELKDGDKYGLEIVEDIKNESQGQIEIRQASLYPLLKKLEKSKFIASYWQDSDIGGKRHYYKLTENGYAQLDTYPPLEELIKENLGNNRTVADNEENDTNTNDTNNSIAVNDDIEVAFDKMTTPSIEQNHVENIEESVDNTINLSQPNTDFIERDIAPDNTSAISYASVDQSNVMFLESSDNNMSNDNKAQSFDIFDALSFEDNCDEKEKEVETSDTPAIFDVNAKTITHEVKMVEHEEKPAEEHDNLSERNDDLVVKPFSLNNPFSEPVKDKASETNYSPTNFFSYEQRIDNDIKFRDYIDYKNDPQIVIAKKYANRKLWHILTTSVVGLCMLFIFLAICIAHKMSPLYAVVFIAYTLYIVLNFCSFVGKYRLLKVDLQAKNKRYNFKRQIIIRSIVYVCTIVTLLVMNLVGVKNGKLFSVDNFGNFTAPILLLTMLFIDYGFAYIYYFNFQKTKKN